MIVIPLLAAIAFLGPPAAAAGVYHGRIAHAVRPAHTQPLVAWRTLSPWWQATWVPTISRAASRVS